jgi:D-arabinitol dehydrogenase (NADP+)
MPVITGHETSGIVVKIGKDVTGFNIDEKVTADSSELCGHCHYCKEGKMLYCENFTAHGLHCKSEIEQFPCDDRNN